jgi:hypothetical protein
MSKGVWPYLDQKTQPKCEAISMLQLLSCGESVEQLRADIQGKPDDSFRIEVLRHFDELIRENKVDEAVSEARERSAKLAEITAARAAYRRSNPARVKRNKPGAGRQKRLSEHDAKRIRELLTEGMTRTEIGLRFHCAYATISRALAEAK